MQTTTHLSMSVIILKNIERNLPIKLDTASFMLGNIKPDISSYLVKIPHFKSYSFDFILSEIKSLLTYKINKYTKCTSEFSQRLGIVTHYISDFFCHAHSDDFEGNLLKHVLYEINLSRFCNRYSRKIKHYDYIKSVEVKGGFKSILDSINALFDEYTNTKPSYSNDIIFALTACISVCVAIISVCIAKPVELTSKEVVFT